MSSRVLRGVRPYGEAPVDIVFADGIITEIAPAGTGSGEVIDADGRVRDGMILREGHVAELPVNYVDLADTLIDPAHPPSLVTLNLYHSGARTARELVRRGAHAAMGLLTDAMRVRRAVSPRRWAPNRSSNPLTSSTSPAANIASTRCSMRRCKTGRGHSKA